MEFKMAIKITDECIGCGACVSIAEEVFEMKGDKAIVKKQKIDAKVKEAIDACPVDAIKI